MGSVIAYILHDTDGLLGLSDKLVLGLLNLLLGLARICGLTITLLVDAPHVDVKDDDGSQLYGVTDQHAK